MGTAIDFNQPIEVIVMALVARIDNIEDGDRRREADIKQRHEENRFRLNVIISLIAIAVPVAPAVFAYVAHLLGH